jgi:hypothetical protein
MTFNENRRAGGTAAHGVLSGDRQDPNSKPRSAAQAFVVTNARLVRKNSLVGTFDVEMPSGLIVRGAMLLEKNGSRWINFPSREWIKPDGGKGISPRNTRPLPGPCFAACGGGAGRSRAGAIQTRTPARSLVGAGRWPQRRGRLLMWAGPFVSMSAPPDSSVSRSPPLREKTAVVARTKTADHQRRKIPMRLIVTQTECAGKLFWIVRDTYPAWLYHGPFADEAAAHAFARPNPRNDWKASYRWGRIMRRQASL